MISWTVELILGIGIGGVVGFVFGASYGYGRGLKDAGDDR